MYKRYNPNPCNKKVGDCVIRAISCALDQPWQKTYKDLTYQGLIMCDYMCMRDLYRLNALLGKMSDVISELYHTCDTSEEVQEFHEFIERVSSITTPTVIERP